MTNELRERATEALDTSSAVMNKAHHAHKRHQQMPAFARAVWLFDSYFRAQRQRVLAAMDAQRSKGFNRDALYATLLDQDGVATRDLLADALYATLTPVFWGSGVALAARLGQRINSPLDPAPLQKYVFDTLAEVDRVSVKRLSNALARIQEAMDDPGDIGADFQLPPLVDPGDWNEAEQAVRSTFDGFLSNRANTIARDMAAISFERGATAYARELADQGMLLEKAWDGSTQPCDDCDQNIQSDWIGLDEEFPSGDTEPPGHPNCQCTLLYRTTNEAA